MWSLRNSLLTFTLDGGVKIFGDGMPEKMKEMGVGDIVQHFELDRN